VSSRRACTSNPHESFAFLAFRGTILVLLVVPFPPLTQHRCRCSSLCTTMKGCLPHTPSSRLRVHVRFMSSIRVAPFLLRLLSLDRRTGWASYISWTCVTTAYFIVCRHGSLDPQFGRLVTTLKSRRKPGLAGPKIDPPGLPSLALLRLR
jgi:hypothetical protein